MTGDERTPLTDAEDDSAEDPRGPIHYLPRTEELYIKGGLAFVFSGVSIFVCFYAQPDLDAWMPYETEWKTFMFALCVFLTLPNIYQTSLVLFTFRAVWWGEKAIKKELKVRRPIWLVLVYALILSFVVPVVLPFACLYLPIAWCKGDKHYILFLVGMIDFIQTIVLVPLGYVVVFSADATEDVFLKTVVVQVFATLDDEFVLDLISGPTVKKEALETYCEEVYTDKDGNTTVANPDERTKALADFAYG